MVWSTPGLPVHHQLPEFTQTHVYWFGDAIQPPHPLSSPSPPPSIFPSNRVFSDESVLHIRGPKYWSFSFSISPSNDWWMTSNDYSWNQLYVNLKNAFLRTCLNKVQCCIPLSETSGFVWMWQCFMLFSVRSTSHQEPPVPSFLTRTMHGPGRCPASTSVLLT